MEKSTDSLSLKKYCVPCGSSCCKISQTIGSPIISEEEKEKIEDYLKKNNKNINCYKRIDVDDEHYYILKENNGDCCFLQGNNCMIQEVKPLDCQDYPVKAVYEDNKIVFIIDTECPASDSLTPEFIEEAKKIALKCMNQFSSKTYNHWLKNFVGWVYKTNKKLD
ncbi:hypothetical protein AYK26_05300 [Euryarchaeota archaeon SM23-78]|nr:MAG: hypothetical protein AYK26_05300 [Euryarchaeota archaeon SM23-78]MBW3001336.1 hypothetical protein [Candidatus Woesearchaeota archaeon]